MPLSQEFLNWRETQRALGGYEENGVGKYRYACYESSCLNNLLRSEGVEYEEPYFGAGYKYTFKTPVAIPRDMLPEDDNANDVEITEIYVTANVEEMVSYKTTMLTLKGAFHQLEIVKANDNNVPENLAAVITQALDAAYPIIDDQIARVEASAIGINIDFFIYGYYTDIIIADGQKAPRRNDDDFYSSTEMMEYLTYALISENQD